MSSYKPIRCRPSEFKRTDHLAKKTPVGEQSTPVAAVAAGAVVAATVINPAKPERYDWNWACRQVGVKFPSKGTPDYDRVMKVFRGANPLPAANEEELDDETKERRSIWKECCAELGVKFCPKASESYEAVMALYVPRIEARFPSSSAATDDDNTTVDIQ